MRVIFSRLSYDFIVNSPQIGPVPSTSSSATDPIGNGGLSPEWGMRISLWDATVHYGPWADRQRAQMQEYFFPSSHRNSTPTPKLASGQTRLATCFETYIEFMNEGKVRVPTREKSKVIQRGLCPIRM